MNVKFTVFTKPWNMSIPELGKFVYDMGFYGIELPVRSGFQVEPENADKTLPEAARQLEEFGIKIDSIAGDPDEKLIAGCADAGISVIRICANVLDGETYFDAEKRMRKDFDVCMPMLQQYRVKIGVQNHCNGIGSAIGVFRLIEDYDPKYIAAIWDPAHCAVDGEPAKLAIDTIWDRLCLVNLKNVIYVHNDNQSDQGAKWSSKWTAGSEGLVSWSEVADLLKKREYNGSICLTAQYADRDFVNELIVEDLKLAKSLFKD